MTLVHIDRAVRGGTWTPPRRKARLPNMTHDELVEALNAAFLALEKVADRDWARFAGSLEWTCWQTIDHTIDCVYSFGLQIGARAKQASCHSLRCTPRQRQLQLTS
jgi:hypothetical protein